MSSDKPPRRWRQLDDWLEAFWAASSTADRYCIDDERWLLIWRDGRRRITRLADITRFDIAEQPARAAAEGADDGATASAGEA